MPAVLFLEGQSALSAFRLEKLQEKARQQGLPTCSIHSQYYYFVAHEEALNAEQKQALAQLLDAHPPLSSA